MNQSNGRHIPMDPGHKKILKSPNSGVEVKGKKDDVGELTEMIKNLRVEVATLKNRSHDL